MEKLFETYFSEVTQSLRTESGTATNATDSISSPSPEKYSETEDKQNTRQH